MAMDSLEARATQALNALHRDFPGWQFWRGHDGHGQLHGWHATRRTPDGSTMVVADDPAQLRQRVEQAAGSEGSYL